MKKRILCLGIVTLLLVACFVIPSAMTASAGSNSGTVNNHLVVTNCYSRSSSHTISSKAANTYPTGNGRLYYTQGGRIGEYISLRVVSSTGSYWNAEIVLPGNLGTAYKASTTLRGYTNNPVTATNP